MLSICGYIFLLFLILCIIFSTSSGQRDKNASTASSLRPKEDKRDTRKTNETKQTNQQSNLVTYNEWKKLQSNYSTTIKPWVKTTYQPIRALRPQISTIPSNPASLADTRITLSHFDRRTEKVYKKEIFENNKDYLCHLKALESRRNMQNEYNKKHGTEKFEEADTPGLFFCDIPEGMSPSMIIYCTGAAILWLVLFGTFSFDRIRQILARLRPFFANNNNNNNGLNANRDNNQNIQMVQIV